MHQFAIMAKPGKLKSKLLGCLCSTGAADAVVVGPSSPRESGGKRGEKKRVTIRDDGRRRPQSPTSDVLSSAAGSVASGRSSVYFDASEGAGEEWQSLTGDDSFDEDSFANLQIDGQYFFTAKDDPTLTKEAFEGIQLYPPLPTTEPDPVPRNAISISNMQTLLHTYQHSGEDAEARSAADEADVAAGMAGIALEHQAQLLMTAGEDKTAEYMGECTNQLLLELKTANVREKGFPGELTEEELEAVKLFRSELKARDPIYTQIVRSLSMVEKEAYALCRWLRARKFDVEKVFELLDQAKEHYAKAREHDFYPDLESCLGISRPIFLSQYPAVFSGNAKNGCPVMYLKLGSIQPEGMKCVVSLDKCHKFFWNDVMHAFPVVLKEGQRINPSFVRTQNITVYDLKGVSRSQITSDTFDMIKVGNQVMTSFPETLHCLLIINAPSWFGMIWSLVKKLIDARTASKIEVFTSSKSGSKRMRELIDENQIPSCYGGDGPSLAEAASGAGSEAPGAGKAKMVVLNQLMALSKKNATKCHAFELEDGKQVTLTVYSRCKAGFYAGVFRSDESLVSEIDAQGGEEDEPYSRTLGVIEGPGSFVVKVKSKSDPGSFLVLGSASA